MNVETRRSIHYLKRYCIICNICLWIGWLTQKQKLQTLIQSLHNFKVKSAHCTYCTSNPFVCWTQRHFLFAWPLQWQIVRVHWSFCCLETTRFKKRSPRGSTALNNRILLVHSFRCLSYDKPIVSSTVRSPHSAISEGPATGHLDTGFSWFPCV